MNFFSSSLKFAFLALLSLLSIQGIAHAEATWVSLNGGEIGQKADIEVSIPGPCPMLNGQECVKVSIRLYGYYIEEEIVEEISYNHISVPGLDNTWSMGIGFPELPYYTSLIEVPREWSDVEFAAPFSTVTEGQLNSFIGQIYPQQNPYYGLDESEVDEIESFIHINIDIMPEVYPETRYTVHGSPVAWNSINIIKLDLFPLLYSFPSESLQDAEMELYLVNGVSQRRDIFDYVVPTYEDVDVAKQFLPNINLDKIYDHDLNIAPLPNKTLLVITGKDETDQYFTDFAGDPLMGVPSFLSYLDAKQEDEYTYEILNAKDIYTKENTWLEKECKLLKRIIDRHEALANTTAPLESVLLVGPVDQIPSWREKGSGIGRSNIVDTFAAVIDGYFTPGSYVDASGKMTLHLPSEMYNHRFFNILFDSDADGSYDTFINQTGTKELWPNPNQPSLEYLKVELLVQNPNDPHRLRVEMVEGGSGWVLWIGLRSLSYDPSVHHPDPRNERNIEGGGTNYLFLTADLNGTIPGVRVFVRDRLDTNNDGLLDSDLNVFIGKNDPQLLDVHWTTTNSLPTIGSDLDAGLQSGLFEIGFVSKEMGRLVWAFLDQTSDYAYSIDHLPNYCDDIIENGEFTPPDVISDLCNPGEDTVCGTNNQTAYFPNEPSSTTHEFHVQYECDPSGTGYLAKKICKNANNKDARCYFNECWEDDGLQFLPVRSVGRFNVHKKIELAAYLAKGYEYQTNALNPPANAFRHFLAMGNDNDYGIEKDNFMSAILNVVGSTNKINPVFSHPSMSFNNLFDDHILPNIEEGLSLFAYSGHGGTNSLAVSSSDITQVDLSSLPSSKRVYPPPRYLLWVSSFICGRSKSSFPATRKIMVRSFLNDLNPLALRLAA